MSPSKDTKGKEKASNRVGGNICKTSTQQETLSRIYKEVLKFNNNKTDLKIGKKIGKDMSPKKICGWQRSTQKDVEHH